MRWFLGSIVMLSISACCLPFGDDPPAPAVTAPNGAPTTAGDVQPRQAAFVAAHLARLDAELPCNQPTTPPALAPLCHAVGWSGGTAAALPQASLVGVTSFVVTDGPVAENLQRQVKLSVLGVRHEGGQVFADITSPSGRPGDMAPTMAANDVMGAIQQNRVGPVVLPLGLYGYYAGRAAIASYPVASAGTGWQYQGGSFADLRRVGDHWVAIETPANEPAGIYVTVFADNPVEGR